MKITLVVILVIALFVGLSFGGLYYYKFFAPKYENARRNVFKETRSYNEGKIQDLAKFKYEYKLADGESKQAIKTTILHMFADFNCEEAPYGLKQFLTEIRGY